MINSSVTKIILKNEFLFDISGGIFFKNRKTLIISDLHFGKGTSLIRKGIFFPPYDFNETIVKLKKLIEKFNPSTVISLGDNFHDNLTINNMPKEQINEITKITNKIKFIWINGNHDNKLVNKKRVGGKFFEILELDKFSFSHIKAKKINKFEFSGHYHPKTFLKINNLRYYFKCFILGENYCILPAFGHYTGGLDVKSNLIKQNIKNKDKLLILGKRKIIEKDYT